MKITELRCPACNGTMKIDEKNPGIAVCEYCGSQYVLEREGNDAWLSTAPTTPPPKPVYIPEKKEEPKKGAQAAAFGGLFVILIAILFVVVYLPGTKSGSSNKSEGIKVTMAAGGTAAGSGSAENGAAAPAANASLTGVLKDMAEKVFEKPAEQITEKELASIQSLDIHYANGGSDICVVYGTRDPFENPDAELTELYFDRSSSNMDLKALANFSGLKKLTVLNYLPEGCLAGLPLQSLSCYAESPQEVAAAFGEANTLTELEIAAGLDSLEGLELLASVESLRLDCYELTDIRELAAAKNVKFLTLESCDEVTDFSVLSVMTWLEGLSVESENLKALTFLSNMTQLKSLGLADAGLINLKGLAERADTLTSLTIDSCGELKECSDIASLSGLKELVLEVPYNCEAPELSGLTELELLDISGVDSISFLKNMPKLKKLVLKSSSVDDTSVFKGLVNLEELQCSSYASGLDSLDFIAGLPALKRLKVSGSTYADISALFNMPTLEAFVLNGLECEINFDKLADNPALKTLEMDGVKLYKNVKVEGGGGFLYVDWDDVVLDENTAFLAHYPNLESLSIADNELTQVEFAVGLGQLKTLDISENYVTDIKPLASAPSLKTLIVTGNPIDNLRVLDEKVTILQ